MQKEYEPIPIPFSEKFKNFRHQGLPLVIFLCVAVIVIFLWDERVNAPGFTGMVVADSAIVTSPHDGQISQFYLNSFDRVEKGDPLAQIVRVDTAYFQARLAHVFSLIRQVEIGQEPMIGRQRNIIDYENLRLDNIQNRIELASLKIQKPQLEARYERAKEIFDQNGMSEEEFQAIESEYLIVESQEEQLMELVSTLDDRLQEIEEYIIDDAANTPLSAAIDVHEKELRVVEEELKPVTLYASISGVISKVHKRDGEYVRTGDEMLEIEATNPSYIVGYIKQPFNIEPEENMKVQVRTRKPARNFFTSYIMRVGGHIESLLPEVTQPGIEQERGLPVQVALINTEDIRLYPGEIVDVVLTP
ncbi:MAG: HlyD family efflux transporter periplasmic adaptor subunit [Balneolaceae bacterium]